MEPKYYHLYSDGKTVKEISREKFFRLLKYERKKNNPRLRTKTFRKEQSVLEN